MALVVFLRGVNVGRHKRFLPAQVAKDLAALDVVNIGAAGTFVVRQPIAASTLRKRFAARLAFDADIIIVTGRELLDFADGTPFGIAAQRSDEQRFASVLLKPLRKAPALPIMVPATDKWQVKIVATSGSLVASVWRRQPGTPIYPNAAVEKQLGVATTRNWNTIATICRLLMG